MNILAICNDKWHQTSTIKKGLIYLEDKFSITWIDNNINWNDISLNKYSLVILSKSGSSWMTDEIEKIFNTYITNGGSLLAIHSGFTEYDNFKVFTDILGGVFDNHPEECIVCYKPVVNHELTNEIVSYYYKDEHSFIKETRDDLDIFLYSESKYGTQPAGWRHSHGKGKVSVLTQGHNLDVWLSFNNRNLIENVIKWLTNPIMALKLN